MPVAYKPFSHMHILGIVRIASQIKVFGINTDTIVTTMQN